MCFPPPLAHTQVQDCLEGGHESLHHPTVVVLYTTHNRVHVETE